MKEFPQLVQRGKRYYFQTTTTPRKKIPLGADEQAVMVQYHALRAEQQRGTGRATSYRTVRAMVDAYIAHLKTNGNAMQGEPLAKSSLGMYRSWAKHIVKTFGTADPRVITQRDIDRYMYECKRTSFSHEMSVLSGAYKHAMRTTNDISFNPCLGVKSEKKQARRTRLLTDSELLAMRNALNPMMRCALDLAYMLGLRPSDLCQLRRVQFADDGDVHTQKTGQWQRFELNDELREVLSEARRLQGARVSEFVLTNRGGRQFKATMITYHWEQARERAGLSDVQFRDIRPKAATDLELQARDDGASAQKFLGHKVAATTRIYLRDRVPNVVVPMKRKQAKAV